MAPDFKLLLQVVDGHLRLVSRGNLTGFKVKQILRATEAGLRVFPVVIVEVQEPPGDPEDVFALLEDGLRYIIAQRTQALLKTEGQGPRKKFSLHQHSAIVRPKA